MSDNEKGFLQVNNQIVDYWMAHLTSAEFKTLLAIVRKTKGWNKPYDRISQSQIAELTGLTTRSVRTAISLLEDKKLIIVAGDDRKTRLFSVNYSTVNDVETDVTAIEKAIKDAEVISKDAEVISHKEEVISKDAEVGFLHNKHYTKDTNNINIKDTTASAKKTKVINICFSDFWNIYDKKKDTAKCEKKWLSLTDNERELIMAHIPAYVKSTPDKKYRKNPMTYFSGKCWLDEIDQPTATKIDRTTDKLAVNQKWAGANKSNIVAANTNVEDMFGASK